MALERSVRELKVQLLLTQNIREQVSLLGQMGVYLRSLDLFDEAETALQQALQKVAQHKLGLRKEIQNKIRLAHVYQEAKKFRQSNSLFNEILNFCKKVEAAAPLLHFALQHSGKNQFDQGQYLVAFQAFEETLELRTKNSAPPDQLESTQSALLRLKEVMNNRRPLTETLPIEDNLILKAVALHEASKFLSVILRNRNHFDSFEFISPQFESLQEVEEVIKELNTYKADFHGASYGLWRGEELCGLFTINKILWHEASADLGFWLTERATGKGVAEKTLSTLIKSCFEELNLQTVTATTAESNLKCRKTLKKLGFVKERDLPAHIQVRGRWVDESLFSLTEEIFESHLAQRWCPLSLEEVKALFYAIEQPYWISGGWALDLYLGKLTRYHEDFDISISRTDQLHFQKVLSAWDLRASDPPGSGKLRPWLQGEFLKSPVHNLWCRKHPQGPWNLKIMLCTFENDEWVYRRNPKIRGSIASFGWQHEDGTLVIAPEIQLLYKSRSPRDEDNQDFENCLKKFDDSQTKWLMDSLTLDSGGSHPWILSLKDKLRK